MPRKITFSVVSILDTIGAIDGTGGAVAIGVVGEESGAVAGSAAGWSRSAAAPLTIWS